jgi:MYXO-CTERM domain-containing protein
VAETNSDSDDTPDCEDMCPMDGEKIEPGACGCNMPETDTDSDNTPDCDDLCPNDANKTELGVCGCGESDEDGDNDGVAACNDVCLGRDSSGDDDDDGICNDRDDKVLVIASSFQGEEGECPAGGVRLDIGTDGDGSTTLSDEEIEQTRYICHGVGMSASGASWRVTSLAPKSEQCAYGGLQIATGTDDDADGELDDAEIENTTVACNASGVAIRTGALAVGSSQCPAGGVRIDTGLDADGDYELDASEVSHSSVVCQSAPLLFDTETLAAGDSSCAQGGVRIAAGADDGAPSGTAGDGVLQSGEIDSMHPICISGATADDVLVNGGSSSCSVQVVGQRPSALGASLMVLGAAWLRRRRARRRS